ncbi:hypothetical protein [Aquisalibacillus elongatus]|uniref:Uncharacterized protein n=1 Tax=Aquisalibacillus elongatus TaxID=485577 RepID=A0A3N5BRE4_9BACI|nr:hypothetical protein [Aquisalibacillus elongatus]RPF50082.1 hypothetical protein EDC24_2899 [Aquisalibacillus elongatus]
MKRQLTKQDFVHLKRLFSDYRRYKRGLPRLFGIGLLGSVVLSIIMMISILIKSGEFNLSVFILILVLLSIFSIILVLVGWLIIKKNAIKFEEKLIELEMTEQELETMIYEDYKDRLGV